MINKSNASNCSYINHGIRIFFCLAMMLVLSVCFKSTVYAYEYSGQCGNNLTYSITGNDIYNLTLTISGTGDMWDYYKGSAAGDTPPWFSQQYAGDPMAKYIKSIIIEEGVTSIGINAFTTPTTYYYVCTVSFPSTLERINDHAFDGANIYGNLVIPTGVTFIGESAFENCDDLNGYISLPNTLTTVGYKAFHNCKKLTGSLVLPNSLKKISGYSFNSMIGISSLTLGSETTEIGASAFSQCYGITSVVIPSKVSLIDQYAFSWTGLKGPLEIPASVKQIKTGAFTNTGLTTITFLGNAPVENEDAFDSNEVNIIYKKNAQGFSYPKWHGYNSEFERTKVTNITVSPTTETMKVGETIQITATIEPADADIKDVSWTINGEADYSDGNVYTFKPEYEGTYRIQATAADGGFIATSTIIVTPPVSVTGISVSPVSKTINLGESVTITATIEPSDAENQEVSWEIDAFDTNDQEVSWPLTAKTKTITITPSFAGTYRIEATSVDGKYVATSEITVKAQKEEPVDSPNNSGKSNVVKVGTKVTYLNGVYKITKLAYSNKAGEATLVSVVKNKKKIKMPKSFKYSGYTYKVTTIAAGACKNNKTITDFTIGANVKTIGDSAFLNCIKLKSAKVPNSVTTIGKNCYRNCSSMTNVSIGTGVDTIKANAYYGCKKAKKWSIKTKKLRKMGANALKNTPKDATYDVPNSLVWYYKTIFTKAKAGKQIKVK